MGGKYLANHKWQNQSAKFYYKKLYPATLETHIDSECRKIYAIRGILWNKFKSLHLMNSLESNLDTKGKKERIYIRIVWMLVSLNCRKKLHWGHKVLSLKISVYEDGWETPLITSCLSCERFNKLSSWWTYITSCCKPWYFLFELSYQMLCLFLKAQLQVSINLVIVWFYLLYLMTILSA